MNEYFRKGFEKTADPELAKETSGSDVGYSDSDSRKERQKLLEYYEGRGNKDSKDDAVKKNDSPEDQTTIMDRY